MLSSCVALVLVSDVGHYAEVRGIVLFHELLLAAKNRYEECII